MLAWVEKNNVADDEALDLLSILEKSLSIDSSERTGQSNANAFKYYIRSKDCGDALDDYLEEVAAESAQWKRIDVIPLRPPAFVGRLLRQGLAHSSHLRGRNLDPDALEQEHRVTLRGWEFELTILPNLGSLDRLLNSEQIQEQNSRCLLAFDICVNRGESARWFLNSLKRRLGSRLLAYRDIRILAIAGFSNSAIPESLQIMDKTIQIRTWFRREMSEEDRPFSQTSPDPVPQYERLLRRSLAFPSGSEEVVESGVYDDIVARLKSRSTFICTEEGCPPIGVPALWVDSNWQPLWRSIDYYVPSKRPFPRAPNFIAYPRTLNDILSRISRSEPVLLHGRQGSGKTFLAARALELCRLKDDYTFWHDCLPFDTIESALEHLDSFCESIGAVTNLKDTWTTRAKVTDVAQQLMDELDKLDRAVVLVFDRIQNVCRREAAAGHFKKFLEELGRKCGRARDRNPEGSVPAPPAVVFILQTHLSESDQSARQPRILEDDRLLNEIRQMLGLKECHTLTCPGSVGDVFIAQDAVRLATMLCFPSSWDKQTSDIYFDLVAKLSHNDPYRTWLLAFFVKRWRGSAQHAVEHLKAHLAQYHTSLHDLHELIVGASTKGDEDVLEPDELKLLYCASVLELPWTISDIEDMFVNLDGRTGHADNHKPRCAETAVKSLLDDQAPFIMSLGSGSRERERTGRLLHSSLRPETPFQGEKFEMPSVSKKFFQSRLDSLKLLQQYCRAAAELMATPKEDVDQRVVQAVYYYCKADDPRAAAELFLSSKDGVQPISRSWDRTRDVCARILKANGADEAAGKRLRDDTWCDIMACHIGALLELFRHADAQEECEKANQRLEKLGDGQSISRCRLKAVIANYERYEGRYCRAEQIFEEVRSESLRVEEKKGELNCIRFWEAQCAMSLGKLERAKECLREVKDMGETDEQELRFHEATLALLSGELNEAKKKLESISPSAPEAASAGFRHAQIELDRICAFHVPGGNVPVEVINALKVAGSKLEEGQPYIVARSPDGAKWQAAYELGRLWLALLRKRFASDGADLDLDDIGERLEDVRHLFGFRRDGVEVHNARSLEVGILAGCLRSEKLLAETKFSSGKRSQRELLDEKIREIQGYFQVSRQYHEMDNPHLQGRSRYEEFWYLWKLRDLVQTQCDLREQNLQPAVTWEMSKAYNCGLDCLYRSDLVKYAIQLHRLARGAFAEDILVQDWMEASLWLEGGLAEDSGDLSKTCEVLDRAMVKMGIEFCVHYWAPGPGARQADVDPFFSIPLKIYCRFTGNHDVLRKLRELVQETGEDRRLGDCPTSLNLEKEIRTIAQPGEYSGHKMNAAARRLRNAYQRWFSSKWFDSYCHRVEQEYAVRGRTKSNEFWSDAMRIALARIVDDLNSLMWEL